MKKFIIMFIAFILLLALIIGQCNNETTELACLEDPDIEQEEDEKDEDDSLVPTIEEAIKDTSEQIIVVNSVEIPKIQRDLPEQILKRSAYTVSYNKETKCPNWVAWYLSADHSDGEWARSNDYREDYEVPSPRATNEDYKGSIWSRGHMCPAGDNKWNADAMSETFLLSNMCPQDRSLNSGFWNQVEMDCRKWAKKYGGVYIVCGPLYYKNEHETIGINQIVVPKAFYKVILRLNPHPNAIGYVVKNNEGTKKKDQYVNTVDEVERLTGIDFFPALPDDIEDEVEAHANLDDWR